MVDSVFRILLDKKLYYYPFGMLQPGRKFNADEYRYGFNGQEKLDEISGSGNHTIAISWEYDTRLGKRWNVDPKIVPSQSPYACFDNNPVYFKDVQGETGEAYIKGNNVIIESKYYFYGTTITPEKATSLAKKISETWNSAKATVTIDGKQYNVKFIVTAVAINKKSGESDAEYTARIAAMASKKDATGYNYKNNYVRIDDINPGQKKSFGFEVSQTPGEVGYWLDDEVYSNNKTESHEYGEGLGLDHPANSMSTNGVLRIMTGNNPGIDAKQRMATQDDINDLNLGSKLSGKKPGERIGLGEKKYEYYEKNGNIIYNSTRIGEEENKK